MSKTLAYKGFTGTVEAENDGTFGGQVLGVADLLIYDGKDMADLEKRFRESVDEHINFCKDNDLDPSTGTPLAGAKAAHG